MGGSPSKEEDTRAAVVSRVEDKEGQVTVEITEELVKDIHEKFQARQDFRGGLKEGEDSLPEEPQQSNRERPDSNNQLLLELEREKSKNREFKAVTLAEIDRTSHEIGRKISDTPLAKVTPICSDLAAGVSHCYVSNPGRTLNCSQKVKEYINCVDHQMKERLLRS